MNLLFSLNESYLPPLKVLLQSLFDHHKEETFSIHLLHAGIGEQARNELQEFVDSEGHTITYYACSSFFKPSDKVAVTRYYTLEMYLWMFAPYILPDSIDRILYLDPDIVCMNECRSFYETDFLDYSFVATNYKYKTKWIQPFNNLRLRNFDSENYFNSGVVLMNVRKLREKGDPEKIIRAIRDNHPFLILPDQDIFNLLYGQHVLEEDWRIYNMNPKVYEKLKVLFPHKYNKEWIEKSVVFIHFCGKHKPWNERKKYRYTLGSYYFEKEQKLHSSIEKGVGR